MDINVLIKYLMEIAVDIIININLLDIKSTSGTVNNSTSDKYSTLIQPSPIWGNY